MEEIKCPCGLRNYMEEEDCKKTSCNACCPLTKPQTNADRIRATDDELATMLHAVKLGYRPWCDYHCENEGDDGCDNCIKEWLQQPADLSYDKTEE